MNDRLTHLADGAEDPKPRPPWISFFLAYVAMVPIVAGAVAAWLLGGELAHAVVRATLVWAGAIVCFLSGVRRGLSFRQGGGPTLAQLATMLWLFVLGVASLLVSWRLAAVLLQIAAYASMAALDPLAADRREAPVYFARLRPVQMLVPIGALLVLLVRIVW